MANFRISGSVIDQKTRREVAGVRVEAWDKDLIYNDLVGNAITDKQGAFQIEFNETYFQELFLDRLPDLFFKIFSENKLITSTENSVLWNVNSGETKVVIEVNISAANTVEKERQEFKALILSNPNYFGNLIDSPYEAVTQITGNPTYEELTCIGFNPDTNLLEATIAIKLPFGYGGDLCSPGSNEYVRFFIDYGGGFEDLGIVAVNVHDIPNQLDCAEKPDKPLSYVVSLKIDPKKNKCDRPVLPKVRAVLSWNAVPSTNPFEPPVWGDVEECYIQIKPRQKNLIDVIGTISDQIGQEIKLPLEYEPVAIQPIPLPDPPPLALADLTQLYGNGQSCETAQAAEMPSVEPHRFGLSDIQTTLNSVAFSQDAVSAKIGEWQALGLNWQEAISALAQINANVDYEQIECLGLDINSDLERLVATFRIKRPIGYSGDLCQQGSLEYIAFWADWDNTCKWTYLDTLTVNVHDIAEIPGDGLCYSVMLPVDLTYHRQKCEKPKIARVRAVLSWSEKPSTVDPDALTVWGNRLDAHVQIKPGPVLDPNDVKPVLFRVGGIPVEYIDDTTGLTLPGAKFENPAFAADNLNRPCPFGGRVIVKGLPFPGYNYRVQVRKSSELVWTTVANTMTIQPIFGPAYNKAPITPDGFFSYETLYQNPDLVLAWWETTGDEKWEVKLEIQGQPMVVTQMIQLKNSAIEETSIHIDMGGDCKDFLVGILIQGTFIARDPYFGSFSLYTLPFPAPPGQLNPTGGTVQTVPAGNPWTLNTTGMAPCGYVVKLDVVDRAILHSVPLAHHWASQSVGFCLRASV